jgi:hypothetical protein
VTPVAAGVGPWRIAVSDRLELTGEFDTDRWLRLSARAASASVSASAEITVEVLRSGSGVVPRALVGGTFQPHGSGLVIEVGSTGDLTEGAPRACESSFDHPLAVGLPEEFAQAALDGLARVVDALTLPPGVLRICAGGYDEVDSSPLAFERAAGALGWVLQETYTPGGLQVSNLTEMIGAW